MSSLDTSSYTIIAITIPLAILLYYILSTTFNRYPKPLPPGPKPWPIVGNLPHMGPAPHQGLAALMQKYGPLLHMRLGSVHVVVAGSAMVAAQFLKAHDANFSSRPPNSGAKHTAYNYQDLVFAPYGPRWRMLRKICALHLFSAKALDDYRPTRQDEVSILIKALAKAGQNPVQLGQLLNVCSTNALSRVMLGRRLFNGGMGKADRKAEEFKDVVVELMVLAGVFNIGDLVPSLEWLDLQGVATKMKKLHIKFDSFMNVILEEHNKGINNKDGQDEDGRDLLSTLISLKDNCDGEGGQLNDIEIKALLLDLFSAGTDTSSSTTEWAMAELIRHPKILAKVHQELDSVVGRDRIVMETDLPNLPYFQAVIKEVFRLHPSTPLSLPRISSEPCEVNGYYIPKNSTLLVNVWAIARDPNAWESPLEFRPERFLSGGEKPNVDVKGNNFELIPFGAGRRICAGMCLGLRMVQFLTASLIHAYDWKLEDGLSVENLNMEEAYGLTLQRKVPLAVHPVHRLSPQAYHTACEKGPAECFFPTKVLA